MLKERYIVSYEYRVFYKSGDKEESYTNKKGSGFKNKENAMKRFKDIKENPNNYASGNDIKHLNVKFITVITDEFEFKEEER